MAKAKAHQLYVELEKRGKWAVRRKGSEHASHVGPTQAAAIAMARKMESGGKPMVERARTTAGGHKGKWRKA